MTASPCCIYIVDDDKANISALNEFLSDDYQVLMWQKQHDIFDFSHQHKIDILIIDINLEQIDGLKACQKIKDSKPQPWTKVILLSSKNLIDDKLQGYMAGADDFLVKPIDHAELIMKMKVYANLINAEKHIANMNESLKQQVELQTTKLIQSEKMASIGQLAAGVAHEINNPMCFISTNLEAFTDYVNDLVKYDEELATVIAALPDQTIAKELLEKQKALKEKYQYQELIEDLNSMVQESLEGASRVSTIVNDLKTFARVDDRLEMIDLNALAKKSLNMIWNQIKNRCDLIKDFGQLKPTLGIETQISQVLINLLLNASQAISDKGVIRIKSFMNDGFNIIEIQDNGCGIPKASIDKIYDPFYTTKPVGVGTGLGLSISYAIIEKHQGRIEVESIENEGTTFKVFLPITS